MRAPRVRLTVQRSMVAVAVAGIALALARIHPALGIFVGCVSIMAFGRTIGAIDRMEAEARPLSAREKVALGFGSLGVAAGILTISIFAFLLTFLLAGLPLLGSDLRLLGIAISVAVAAWASSEARKGLWAYTPPDREAATAEPPKSE